MDLKMDLDGLELKLHEVHFAVKFSEAEAQPRLCVLRDSGVVMSVTSTPPRPETKVLKNKGGE